MNLFSAFVEGISICMPKLWVSSFQWRCYLSAHLALFRIPRCGKIHLIRLISKAKEMVRRPGPYLSTAIFDLNHPPCPLFVICAREENFASFAISPHAGFVIGERANAHNAGLLSHWRRENKSRKKPTRCNLRLQLKIFHSADMQIENFDRELLPMARTQIYSPYLLLVDWCLHRWEIYVGGANKLQIPVQKLGIHTHTYTFILHRGVQAALQNISAFCLARRPPGLFFSLARSFVPSSVPLPPLRPERKTSFRHVRDEARELSQREREDQEGFDFMCVAPHKWASLPSTPAAVHWVPCAGETNLISLSCIMQSVINGLWLARWSTASDKINDYESNSRLCASPLKLGKSTLRCSRLKIFWVLAKRLSEL